METNYILHDGDIFMFLCAIDWNTPLICFVNELTLVLMNSLLLTKHTYIFIQYELY